jgi:hypothetical protein
VLPGFYELSPADRTDFRRNDWFNDASPCRLKECGGPGQPAHLLIESDASAGNNSTDSAKICAICGKKPREVVMKKSSSLVASTPGLWTVKAIDNRKKIRHLPLTLTNQP